MSWQPKWRERKAKTPVEPVPEPKPEPVATKPVIDLQVARTGKAYFDTCEELERIYQEVMNEARFGVPFGPSPEPAPIPKQYEKHDFKPYDLPASEKAKAQQQYDEVVKMLRYGEKPGNFGYDYVVGPPPVKEPIQEPAPAGVTLEELFAEDGETL